MVTCISQIKSGEDAGDTRTGTAALGKLEHFSKANGDLMFMSNKERKREQETKSLIEKKKVNVAGGVGLLFFPEEKNAFDNFMLHNVYTIRRVQRGHRVLL